MILNTKLLHFILKIFCAKKMVTRKFLKPSRSKTFKVPNSLIKEFQTEQFLVNDRNVVTFIPEKFSVNKHLFFLHGGAYAAEAMPSHWSMAKYLIEKTAFCQELLLQTTWEFIKLKFKYPMVIIH